MTFNVSVQSKVASAMQPDWNNTTPTLDNPHTHTWSTMYIRWAAMVTAMVDGLLSA